MGEKYKTYFIVVIAVIVVAIIIFMAIKGSFSKKVELEPLTDEDFKILSVAWQTYEDEYDKLTKNYFLNENKPINWNQFCEISCEEYGNCKSWDWEIITKVAENKGCDYYEGNEKKLEVRCEMIIDGIKKLPHSNPDGSTSFLGFGNVGIFDENIYGRLEGLDVTKDHTLSFCCSNECMKGEVCQTFTLPNKCPLN